MMKFLFKLILCSVFVSTVSAIALVPPPPASADSVDVFVPSAPGGSRDVYARFMARTLPKYLPGKPALIVKNMPGAGGDIMLNYLYHRAKKDGSAIATATNAMYRAQRLGIGSARYDLRNFNFIGAMPESPYFIVIRGDHPIKSFKDLLESKKPIFYGSESETGVGSTEMIGHALKTMGVNLKFVPGYRGSALRVASVLKGELDVTLDRFATSEDEIREGRLRVLLVLTHGDSVPPEIRGNAPEWFKLDLTPEMRELSDFIVTPTDLDKTYLAPPGVPKKRVQELRTAFNKALEDPTVKQILKKRLAISPSVRGEVLQDDVMPRLLGVSQKTVTTIKGWIGR
ncbi:MAG: hypothetical protein GTO40_24575 [Deltaproteobacteria bacterium]|nr:hypothetical protein [Deltaproteobacteria bacterium]